MTDAHTHFDVQKTGCALDSISFNLATPLIPRTSVDKLVGLRYSSNSPGFQQSSFHFLNFARSATPKRHRLERDSGFDIHLSGDVRREEQAFQH